MSRLFDKGLAIIPSFSEDSLSADEFGMGFGPDIVEDRVEGDEEDEEDEDDEGELAPVTNCG